MTDKEILEKAIQKAIDGGWLIAKKKAQLRAVEYPEVYDDYDDTANCIIINLKNNRIPVQFESTESIIFNHNFAKALWGDNGTTIQGLKCSGDEGVVPYWAYNLQQMVIAENPIKYLGENI